MTPHGLGHRGADGTLTLTDNNTVASCAYGDTHLHVGYGDFMVPKMTPWVPMMVDDDQQKYGGGAYVTVKTSDSQEIARVVLFHIAEPPSDHLVSTFEAAADACQTGDNLAFTCFGLTLWTYRQWATWTFVALRHCLQDTSSAVHKFRNIFVMANITCRRAICHFKHLLVIDKHTPACCVCWERTIDVVLPCGHRNLCHACVRRLTSCPVCRKKFSVHYDCVLPVLCHAQCCPDAVNIKLAVPCCCALKICQRHYKTDCYGCNSVVLSYIPWFV